MKNALIIEAEDNVVVVTDDVSVGEKVGYTLKGQNIELTAATDVPVYHKIARMPISKGNKVIKYGQIIGVATSDIAEGEHVHIHNVKSMSREVQ